MFGLGPFLLLPHVEGERTMVGRGKMGMFMKPPNENLNMLVISHTL